ncbi:hypothetical protein EYF80_008183 [Liparis tanakae]|uniref:Uncharacterized protein n=1 Tax=Liparis tanakae TaxID=230148 RepID=A0A4Z2IVF6_9TELE|nr:hypothetical protein EYF80_008183 [Liparis tanakae]
MRFVWSGAEARRQSDILCVGRGPGATPGLQRLSTSTNEDGERVFSPLRVALHQHRECEGSISDDSFET